MSWTKREIVTNAFEEDNGLRYDLTAAEKVILRWADLADGALYCAEEIEMGNTTMYGTLRRYAQNLPLVGNSAAHVGMVVQIRMREVNDLVNLTLEANNDDSK